jgi:hypothetical protein
MSGSGVEEVFLMVANSLRYLNNSQNSDGGWGYTAGEPSTVEATAAVTVALQGQPDAAELRDPGLAWLVAAQHRDGGWGLTRDDAESGWQTAWAALALVRATPPGKVVERAIEWLLDEDVLKLEDDVQQRTTRTQLAIDPALRGWPWLPGQATWVEPTALTIQALAQVPPTPAISARTDEAVRYLKDRRCTDGGWNVGNPVMLGASLPPRAEPTAWVLLALARLARDAIVPQDLDTLRACMAHDGGTLGLAWGLLALRALGEDDPVAAVRLARLGDTETGWNDNPYHTAVATMAGRGSL